MTRLQASSWRVGGKMHMVQISINMVTNRCFRVDIIMIFPTLPNEAAMVESDCNQRYAFFLHK